MSTHHVNVRLSEEAFVKIQTHAEVNGIDFTKATNEIVLRPNDVFQLEVRNILEHQENATARITTIERNQASVTDILAAMSGSLKQIQNIIAKGN